MGVFDGPKEQALSRAIEVISNNAARRYMAGEDMPTARREAVAEFSERWPRLGRVAGEYILAQDYNRNAERARLVADTAQKNGDARSQRIADRQGVTDS